MAGSSGVFCLISLNKTPSRYQDLFYHLLWPKFTQCALYITGAGPVQDIWVTKNEEFRILKRRVKSPCFDPSFCLTFDTYIYEILPTPYTNCTNVTNDWFKKIKTSWQNKQNCQQVEVNICLYVVNHFVFVDVFKASSD